ncbi:MAG: ATP-grasp domain-containing protein [Candidatus Hodarchaeales archaeon]|jgi:succinyl-CoA synthetase beta subunit
MRLYEYEAKNIFKIEGIPTPNQLGIIHSMEDLKDLKNLTFPLMLKAMVLIGGRGKAGGIKKAENINEVNSFCQQLFDLTIRGYPVKTILLEEAVNIKDEIYLSITTDPITFDVVIVTSASGGVDIEQVARKNPEAIWKKKLPDNPKILPKEIAEEAATFLINSLSQKTDQKNLLESIITNLYTTFQNCDAKICEINPLALVSNNEHLIIAADAKIVLDDNALYRQEALLTQIGVDPESKRHDVAEQTAFEARSYKASIIGYVDLLDQPENFHKDKNSLYVGLIPGGAGYGIFSIDEVVNIGNRFFDGRVVPINFMDSGGGPSLLTVTEMFHILMDHPIPDLIVTSRFGGISSCDIYIRGLIRALRDRYTSGKRMIPVYGRMVGTDLPEARAFFEKAKEETPEPLKDLHMVIGNQKIMADVIKDALEFGFNVKEKE